MYKQAGNPTNSTAMWQMAFAVSGRCQGHLNVYFIVKYPVPVITRQQRSLFKDIPS
jgi:hypothetical protein